MAMASPYDDLPIEVRRNSWGWWGEPWPSGICYKQDNLGRDILPYEWDWEMNVPVPVGEKCLYCDEEIVEGDQGQRQPYVKSADTVEIINVHRECSLRQVMGPLAHLEKRCHCYGGTDHDTPGLTRRQEAVLVWQRWLTLGSA